MGRGTGRAGYGVEVDGSGVDEDGAGEGVGGSVGGVEEATKCSTAPWKILTISSIRSALQKLAFFKNVLMRFVGCCADNHVIFTIQKYCRHLIAMSQRNC